MGILDALGVKDPYSDSGVSIGNRLGIAGLVLGNLAYGRPTDIAVPMTAYSEANLNRAKQKYLEDQLKARKIAAERLAKNLRTSNPELADMIIANPELVDEYYKNQLGMEAWSQKNDVEQQQKLEAEKRDQGYKIEAEKRAQEAKIAEEKRAQEAAKLDPLYQQRAQELAAAQAFKDKIAAPIAVPDPAKVQGPVTATGVAPAGRIPALGIESSGDPTTDKYRVLTGDPNLNRAEANRLASAAMRGPQAYDEEYQKVIDDRANAIKAAAEQKKAETEEASLKLAEGEKRKGEVDSSAQIVTSINNIRQIQSESWAPVTGILTNSEAYRDWYQGATDVKNELETIGGIISVTQLQKMRAQNKTGAAVGNPSDKDMALLRQLYGNIKQSSNGELFNKNLDKLEQAMFDVINGTNYSGQRDTESVARDMEAIWKVMPKSAIDSGITPMIWSEMTPDERKAFP